MAGSPRLNHHSLRTKYDSNHCSLELQYIHALLQTVHHNSHSNTPSPSPASRARVTGVTNHAQRRCTSSLRVVRTPRIPTPTPAPAPTPTPIATPTLLIRMLNVNPSLGIRNLKFDYDASANYCAELFDGVQPNPKALATRFGGYAIPSSSTNLIWSNGGLDPWHGGGESGFQRCPPPTNSTHTFAYHPPISDIRCAQPFSVVTHHRSPHKVSTSTRLLSRPIRRTHTSCVRDRLCNPTTRQATASAASDASDATTVTITTNPDTLPNATRLSSG